MRDKSFNYKSNIRTICGISLSLASAFVIIFGIFSHDAYASTITAINPTADAVVKKDNPTYNYGSLETLSCQGIDLRISYFKFDLTQFAGKSIVSAKLRIKTVSDGGSKDAKNIKLVANNDWSESTITYSNSYNGSDSTLKPSTTLASISGAPSGTWIEIPLTSIVSQKKGGMLSFACVPVDITSTDDMKINSREATADKPALIVEHNPAATPTVTKTPTPKPSSTLTPTPSPTPAWTVTPTPTGGGFSGISLGQNVSGTIYVTFYTDQATTKFLRFFIDDKFLNQEHTYPYSLGGDTNGVVNGFDTRQLTNGVHTLKAEIHYTDGTISIYEVSFTVDNLTQISPPCVQRVACTTGSTNPLCIPNIEPFGGWCPAVTITNVPTPTLIPTAGNTIAPTGSGCPLKPQGDANCDSIVDMIDYEMWRDEFIAGTSQSADFDNDSSTDLVDYEAWRSGFVARLTN